MLNFNAAAYEWTGRTTHDCSVGTLDLPAESESAT